MKGIPNFSPVLAPYGNVPWLGFQIAVQKKTKYVFYAKINELIIQKSRKVVDLYPGINDVAIPINAEVNIGDVLAVCCSELGENYE